MKAAMQESPKLYTYEHAQDLVSLDCRRNVRQHVKWPISINSLIESLHYMTSDMHHTYVFQTLTDQGIVYQASFLGVLLASSNDNNKGQAHNPFLFS